MVRGLRVITRAMGVARTSMPASRLRRRSPSVYRPSRRPLSSTTAVMPSILRLISARASLTVASAGTRGTASPVCMTSAMCSSRRRPRAPAGCERAKSSAVKPRASSRATASASPMASEAVVLEVGARCSGQASAGTLTSRCTAAAVARVEPGRPVIETRALPWRLSTGSSCSTSSDSPEYDSASTTSASVTMPRSPWPASPGWTKKAGVPVEARVAAILRATCPDLPMPVQTTRPRQASSRAQARLKSPSMRASTAARPWRSISKTRRPLAAKSCAPGALLGCSLLPGISGPDPFPLG